MHCRHDVINEVINPKDSSPFFIHCACLSGGVDCKEGIERHWIVVEEKTIIKSY